MKKITNLLFLSLFVCAMTQFAFAQDHSDISIGAGVAYGLDIEEIGIQLNGQYTLNDKMRVGADFIYWLTNDDFGDYTALEVNTSLQYLLYNNNNLIFYGLGSLGVHYVSYSFLSASVTDTELGLGLGAGLEYNIGGIKLYTEPRIYLSGLDQFQISAGVRLPI